MTAPDPVAVERAIKGDPPERLLPSEMFEAVRQLTEQGKSAGEVAARLGCSPSTVWRHRARMRPGVFTPAMFPVDFPALTSDVPCQQDPELFFPTSHDNAEPAKRVCRGCTSQQPCGEYALAHPEVKGVWAAMTEKERRKIRRRRAA